MRFALKDFDYDMFGSEEMIGKLFRQLVPSGMGMVSFLGIVVAEPLGVHSTFSCCKAG